MLWVELQPRDGQPPATPLTRVLSLLLQLEAEVPGITSCLRQQAASDPLVAEVLPLIPAILLTRFRDQSIEEICAMGGITLDDLSPPLPAKLTPLHSAQFSPGGLMELSNASLQRGGQS